MLVTRIVAVDSDNGDNGRVTYVISGGNEGNIFSLGYDTGVLMLTRPLSTGSGKTFSLNVTANDHGTPTRQARMTVKLSMENSSENPPRFVNAQYFADVVEDSPIGTFVLKVTAKSSHVEGKCHKISCMTYF